jgi:magnesium-protoporphyrin IX monomethyl ester (oxidative) cyclase
LDIDHPAFRAGMESLFRISQKADAAKNQGGLAGRLKQGFWAVAACATFGRLYLLPVKRNVLPRKVRMAPAW